MNNEWIAFHLKEVQEDLGPLIEKLSTSDYSEEEFAVDIQHIYHHLNTAWNSRHASTKQANNCAQQDFDRWRKFPLDINMGEDD